MIEIKVPESIKVGGFDFKVEIDEASDQELRGDGDLAQCSHRRHTIRIGSFVSPQQFSECFLHEILHAIDGVYGNYKLTEDNIQALANGLLQVMEQLNTRFVR